ncbi:unnamed protein product [Prunus armeniaca]|uniref:Uncharacterized protein n=1 Tax=Prunus armeniaca TaxID=36596 RepID=A0A6J5XQF2_PRUAR|nr:unnamed protein product [Prunus armeniaca]
MSRGGPSHCETQVTQELEILQSHNRPLDPATEPPPSPPPHLDPLSLRIRYPLTLVHLVNS